MLSRNKIPNLLTFARVAAVPVCLAIIMMNPTCAPQALLWIFVAAAITDFFDGYLARKWNAISPLGTMLDPVADKLLVALMLIYLLTVFGQPVLLAVILILMRELYISGLREFLSSRQIALPVSKSGKWKTTLQLAAITLLLINNAYPALEKESFWAGITVLYLSAILALTSAAAYTSASFKRLG